MLCGRRRERANAAGGGGLALATSNAAGDPALPSPHRHANLTGPMNYAKFDKIAAELSSDDEDIDTNMPRKNDDASDFASRRAAACMTALSHDSMFESALESALDTGKCTQEQLDELNGLKLAFDAFAKAAIDAKAAINAKDTKLIKFGYEQLRESDLPELVLDGDLEGCQRRMLLFLTEHSCVGVVQLHDLQSRPELNGRLGKRCGELELLPSGRWPIEVWVDGQKTGKKEQLRLKTKNLRPAAMETRRERQA